MTLILRRTSSEFVPDWDRDKFCDVYHEDLCVGSIVEAMGPSGEPPQWSWSVIIHAGRHRNGIRAQQAIDGRADTRGSNAGLPEIL